MTKDSLASIVEADLALVTGGAAKPPKISEAAKRRARAFAKKIMD